MAVVWQLVVLEYLRHHASREHRHGHPLRKNDTSMGGKMNAREHIRSLSSQPSSSLSIKFIIDAGGARVDDEFSVDER